MAGSILRCFRSQILILNGRGSSLRSLSSDSGLGNKTIIIPSDPFANSLKSLSSYCSFVDKTPDPFSNSLKSLLSDSGLVQVDEKTVSSDPFADSLKSISSDCCDDYKSIISSDPFANLELLPGDIFRPSETIKTGYWFHLTGRDSDYMDHAIDSTKGFIQRVIRIEELNGVVYKAFKLVSNHSIFEACSVDTKLKILSTVFDRTRNYSQAKSSEVFLMNIFLKSMFNDDSRKDITKDEVTSRVLDVIQSYLKVGHHKVTEETHLFNDLGLQAGDYIVLHKALYLEFKLYVGLYDAEVSCKQLIDYIYDNRMERMDFEEFREFNITGHIFWPGLFLIWGPGQKRF